MVMAPLKSPDLISIDTGRFTNSLPPIGIPARSKRDGLEANAEHFRQATEEVAKAAAVLLKDPRKYRYTGQMADSMINFCKMLPAVKNAMADWMENNRNIEALNSSFDRSCKDVGLFPGAETLAFCCLAARQMKGTEQITKISRIYDGFIKHYPEKADDQTLQKLTGRQCFILDLDSEEMDVYKKLSTIFFLQDKSTEKEEAEQLYSGIFRKFCRKYADVFDPGTRSPDSQKAFETGMSMVLKIMKYAVVRAVQNHESYEAPLWMMLYTKYLLEHGGAKIDMSFTEVCSNYYMSSHAIDPMGYDLKKTDEITAFMLEKVKKNIIEKTDESAAWVYIIDDIYANTDNCTDAEASAAVTLAATRTQDLWGVFRRYFNSLYFRYRMDGIYDSRESFIAVMKDSAERYFRTDSDHDGVSDLFYRARNWFLFYFTQEKVYLERKGKESLVARYEEEKQEDGRKIDDLKGKLSEEKTKNSGCDAERMRKKLAALEGDLKAARKKAAESASAEKAMREKLRAVQNSQDELIQLRDIVHSYENEATETEKTVSEDDLQKMAEFLDSRKGAVIGGHDNFRKRLSQYLPSWKMYPIEKAISRKDAKALDIVLACTNHLDHASYETTQANLQSIPNCSFIIVKQTNMEIVLDRIYREYQRQRKNRQTS